MLKIFFTADDLARTKVAAGPSPLWELVLSLHQLQLPANMTGPFQQWHGLTRLMGPAQAAEDFALLRVLVPPTGYFPDFLTPPDAVSELGDDIDLMLRSSRQRLHGDLSKLARERPLPSWGRDMAAGDTKPLIRLGSVLRSYYARAIASHQIKIQKLLDGERARLGALMLTGGVEAVLRSLHHSVRWEPPVLITEYPRNHQVHLEGRGLQLVPSFFCRHQPVSFADPTLPPLLVYPVNPMADWLQSTNPACGEDRHLGALLGQTRAGVLRALRRQRTTSELARTCQLSNASASEHASVLRGAGLITTERAGRAMVHRLTSLGRALLAGQLDSTSW